MRFLLEDVLLQNQVALLRFHLNSLPNRIKFQDRLHWTTNCQLPWFMFSNPPPCFSRGLVFTYSQEEKSCSSSTTGKQEGCMPTTGMCYFASFCKEHPIYYYQQHSPFHLKEIKERKQQTTTYWTGAVQHAHQRKDISGLQVPYHHKLFETSLKKLSSGQAAISANRSA